MPRKTQSRKGREPATGSTQVKMLDAVHQIWLAGLGAAVKARRGGPQVFEDLVSEGARVHAQTRGAAQKALRGVLGGVQERINSSVGEVRGHAEDTLANLEKIFQTRVHRALAQIGVPSAEQIQALSKRVDALNTSVERLARARKGDGHRRLPPTRKTAARHAAAS